MATKPKSKLAYLSYDQIQPRIESGELDQYDLVYEKNQRILYMIDKDKNVIPISSRLVSYESEQEAIADLNNRTDTYPGQVINVLNDGMYIPYVVNKNNDNEYYITSIAEICEYTDYNKLSNVPIINIIANAGDNLVLSELNDGYYNILGTFKISPIDSTTHIVTSSVLYVIKHRGGNSYVRPLDSIDNELYIVDAQGETSTTIVPTMDEVKDEIIAEIEEYITKNMATSEDVDSLFD